VDTNTDFLELEMDTTILELEMDTDALELDTETDVSLKILKQERYSTD
jgi:hypothetical protein